MDRPAYHDFVGMDRERELGVTLARQVVATVAPYMSTQLTDAAVLDLGCGYGDAAGELARLCRSVVGMGAVVVCDVPDGVTVVGNPARVTAER